MTSFDWYVGEKKWWAMRLHKNYQVQHFVCLGLSPCWHWRSILKQSKSCFFFPIGKKKKKVYVVIFGCGRGGHVTMQHFNWDKNLLRTEWWNVTGASGASQHVLWCLQILHGQSTDTQQTVAEVSPFPDYNSKSSRRKKEETKIDKSKISKNLTRTGKKTHDTIQ